MARRNFDERYPAMFQPGGDMTGAPVWAPAANSAVNAGPAGAPLTPVPEEMAHTAEPAANIPGTSATPVHHAATSTTWPPRLWLVPLGAAVVMIAAGIFTLTAQYWVPSSMEMEPAKYQGMELRPWGQIVFAAAPALLGTGIGILATLLFLASRRKAAWEPALRTSVAVVALAVGTAGWVGLFAAVMFPGAALRWAGGGSRGLALPWTYLVGSSGTWLFAAALLMLAVLFVVPRRWQQSLSDDAMTYDAGLPDPAENGTTCQSSNPSGTRPTGARPSTVRGLWFGAAAVAAGMFAMFAPYMFPLATGMVTVELSEGQMATHQDWAISAQNLVSPLLLVGLLVLGWALVSLAITPRRDPAAELEISGVEHPSEEP